MNLYSLYGPKAKKNASDSSVLERCYWPSVTFGNWTSSVSTEITFEKIEDEEINKQLSKLKNNLFNEKDKNEVEEARKKMISFDDFSQLDIKTGTILKAEKMVKTEKLFGVENRLGSGTKNHSVWDCP